MSEPIAYLITFHTYGTWLHGDDRGSVNRYRNVFGTDLVTPSERLRAAEQENLEVEVIKLDAEQRRVVEAAVEGVVQYRGWTLHALPVRMNHVHVVICADAEPERVMNTFKSWATRRLREARLIDGKQKVWTRHGSTQYLWKQHELLRACEYVAEHQGRDLA